MSIDPINAFIVLLILALVIVSVFGMYGWMKEKLRKEAMLVALMGASAGFASEVNTRRAAGKKIKNILDVYDLVESHFRNERVDLADAVNESGNYSKQLKRVTEDRDSLEKQLDNHRKAYKVLSDTITTLNIQLAKMSLQTGDPALRATIEELRRQLEAAEKRGTEELIKAIQEVGKNVVSIVKSSKKDGKRDGEAA